MTIEMQKKEKRKHDSRENEEYGSKQFSDSCDV